MDEKAKPARVVVSEAWRKEQQAKRAAYEAKRRAWVGTFESGTKPATMRAPGLTDRQRPSPRNRTQRRSRRGADAGAAAPSRTGVRRASRSDTPGTLLRWPLPRGILLPAKRAAMRALGPAREKRREPGGPRRGASPEGGQLGVR